MAEDTNGMLEVPMEVADVDANAGLDGKPAMESVTKLSARLNKVLTLSNTSSL